MITFRRVRWRNFLKTGNYWVEVDLSTPGATLIVGENGAGKSTILDAITVALFNKPYRKINKPQLVNAINKRDCVVEVELESGGSEYRIVRGVKPALFEVWRDGKMLDSDPRAQQEDLERRVLRCEYRSFCQVVVLGSATFLPFMQLPPWQRREVIEDLLDLQVFGAMKEVLRKRASEHDRALAELRHEEQTVSTFVRDLEAREAKRRAQTDVDVEEKRERIRIAREEIDHVDAKLREVVVSSSELSKLEDSVARVLKQRDSLRESQMKIEINRDESRDELEFFEHSSRCPKCEQEITDDHKAMMVQGHRMHIRDYEEGLKLLDERLTETKRGLDRLVTKIDRAREDQRASSALASKREALVEYVREVASDIASIRERRGDDGDLAAWVGKLEALRSDLAAAEEHSAVMTIAGNLLQDDGVKARIIRQYVPVINAQLARYMERMEFMCRFELDESFEERILSRNMDEFSYECFSQGEKQRIDLALLFTWREVARMKNSVATNLLILDEVFDKSLDGAGIELVSSIIHELAGDHKVIVISHRDVMVDRFVDVKRFVTRNRFSQLEEH